MPTRLPTTQRPTQLRNRFKAVVGIAAAALVAIGMTACGSAAPTTGGGAAAAPANNAKTSQDPTTLTIVHIPGEEQETLSTGEKLIQKVLEKELGMKVNYIRATSYAATIEAQRAGKAQVAGYGPFSYAVAHDSGAGVSLIGVVAATKGGSTGYRSVASVRADSGITSLKQAKGKKVCFVDPISTSGFLYPTDALMQAGINPKKDIKSIYAGTHPASVLALHSGQCDIAFSTQDTAEKQLIQTGQIKKGELKQIWTSTIIPNSPVTVSTKLSPALQQKIRNVYLNDLNVDALKKMGMCDKSDKTGDCDLGGWGYIPVKDSDYNGIRAVCKITKADACTNLG